MSYAVWRSNKSLLYFVPGEFVMFDLMAQVMVHLIGGQMAPNLFLLREEPFQQADWHLFITTALMEERNKVQHLMLAANIAEAKCQKILVQEDNLEDIKTKLDGLDLNQEDEYWVNITGGTKMMSLSVAAYFSQSKYRGKMYYVPIGQAFYWQTHPLDQMRKIQFEISVDIPSYLTCYGLANVSEQSNTPFPYTLSYGTSLMDWYLQDQKLFDFEARSFKDYIGYIRKIFNADRGRAITYTAIPNLQNFVTEIGFKAEQRELLESSELTYLTSGWFEDWVGYHVKTHLSLSGEFLKLRMALQEIGADSGHGKREFDILFMYKKTLYVLECKTGFKNQAYNYIQGELKGYLSHLAGLRKRFGINVRVAFFTLSDRLSNKKGKKKNNFVMMANTLEVLLFDRYDLLKPPAQWIDQLIND